MIESDQSTKQSFSLSASQNDARAQYNLGIMYKSGLGIKQDYQKAKAYLNQACLNKLQNSCDNYKSLQ